jgi:hypothetical protein
MARDLFELIRGPKELWMVEGAKHNGSLHVAGEEYGRRVLEFFDRHLAVSPDGLPKALGSREPRDSARVIPLAPRTFPADQGLPRRIAVPD